MAKIRRKGESGAAKNFITRNMAIKKLQVTLADFRRLCILKGIYPREPRNKKKANKGSTAPTTFYYTKDISYLLHEPVLNKFRDHKIFARKLSKALGKQEYNTAKRLEENKPIYTLDHIIKERFPTFIDALRDLDDALSMLFLFASMPTTDKVGTVIIQNCDRLCREFEHYVIRSRTLRKVFLSIKGIYYQAEIKGQDITWLVPYKFSQQVPTDVDFRIMLTFLEFHQTFVGFVNYRLYSELGLVYPPRIDSDLEDSAGGLSSLQIESKAIANGTTKKIKPKRTARQAASLDTSKIAEAQATTTDEMDIEEDEPEGEDADEIDTFVATGASEEDPVLPTLQNTSASTNLFKDFHFYLSREVPRYSLEFVLRAFGAEVSWDPTLGAGSTYTESNSLITHHICDRPNQELRFPDRRYLQPQWVYDCINKGALQSLDAYLPGSMLPPHLSPFVKVGEGYDPLAEINEESDDEEEMDTREQGEIDTSAAQVELEAEAAGIPFSEFTPVDTKRGATMTTLEKEEKEGKDLAKMMMSNKQKKLYAKMKYSNAKKENEAKELRQRRRELK